ncbi:hypothetical protein [Iamia sp.]|uniref:hypothetical protein n=1 Tax=Iamia sp. TaxID=2722710 RepID=UPI002D1A387C|nr:hypothetical protein [Iamia sp.]HXH57736.1 hypothetical protein [Iamia sp.]
MAPEAEEPVVDFPTLWVVPSWIEQHCIIPDGFHKGRRYVLADWQLWCTVNHYRVRPETVWVPERPVLAPAFQNRRSLVVAPQKTGKGPWAASMVCVEAVGPALFGGWAEEGERYLCAEHGCSCGWSYDYEVGEPKGIAWPTPLIQLTATSEDQVGNIYKPLQSMIRGGPLAERMLIRGDFIRLPNDGEIQVVTASASSRLGNPVTFVVQDETGLYTKSNKLKDVAQTQRRGAAGMGGRVLETTNCWDPAEESTAQDTFEALAEDVFRFYRKPPAHLSYGDKRERARVHRFVYQGSWWVDLDGIENEAAELIEKDPAQAERFFGNRVVHGKGTWLKDGLWDLRTVKEHLVPEGSPVCAGFDGSDNNDHTAIRLETFDGHRFTPRYGPDRRPTIWDPAQWGGEIPRGEVNAAVEEVCRRYRVKRAYCDPRDWQTEIGTWALEHGDDVFVPWPTNKIDRMYAALNRFVNDLLVPGRTSHDSCPITSAHVANARKVAKPGDKYILAKPTEHQKIDAAMADVLAHEAAADARAAGWTAVAGPPPLVFGF